MPDTQNLADAVIDLGRLALAFAAVDRTGCYQLDSVTPESDSDHTVMLALIAPALAERFFPQLDPALVAVCAVVHDLPEAYCGDTPTLRIDAAALVDKYRREAEAAGRIAREFGGTLPWVPRMLYLYEAQQIPEARFVRAVDKLLPKIVHLLGAAKGLREQGMGSTELAEFFKRQRADIETYAGEFGALMDLHAELVERTLLLVRAQEAASLGAAQ